VEVELASDGRDGPLGKEAQEHADFFSEGYAAQEELAGRKKPVKPSGGQKWPSWWRNPLFWLALIVLMVWVVFGTNAAQWPWDTSEPTAPTEEPSATASTGATVTGQGTPSSDSDPDVEGDPPPPVDEDDAAYAPIEVHVDVGAENTAVSDQYVSSFFQLWPAPKAEGDLPPLATPHLSGGTFDIAFDFEAMTVSGSFDLTYERNDDEEQLCKESPETFSGTARGAFKDFPIRKAETSKKPPSDWGLPVEDWLPMEADGWYVGGSFPVELAMSGVAVMGCATLDGVTTYGETPFNETEPIESWMTMTVDVHRNQGADHKTVAWVALSTNTDEASAVKPYWDHSFAWSQVFERPIPDPLG
jgi:hypothetical protein